MKSFVNDSSGAATLAEANSLLRSKRAWAVLVAVAIVLALGGPFGTLESLSFTPRVGYWAGVCLGSFALGFVVSMQVSQFAEARGLPSLPALMIGLAFASVPIALWNSTLRWLFLGHPLGDAFLDLFIEVLIVALLVGGLYELFTDRTPSIEPIDLSARDAFLAKLPREIGRDCLHIQAQDHYLRVTTTEGSALILMPLGKGVDALGDLGLRVHRSWWIARDHLSGTRWKNGTLFAVLSNGETIPVGRSHRKAVLAAAKVARSQGAEASGVQP